MLRKGRRDALEVYSGVVNLLKTRPALAPSAMQCGEMLSEVPLKSAALQASPATLLHRTIQRRLTQAQLTPGHRARRRLFSAVDADEVSRFVKRELAAIRAADRRRYNFDFDKMQPLEGRFQWERVGGAAAAHAPCENTPLHRSARRLELDCPRAAAAERDGEQGKIEDAAGMNSTSADATCPGKHRLCLVSPDDASSKTLKEIHQLRCGQSQDSCFHPRTPSEKSANTCLQQTALTGENHHSFHHLNFYRRSLYII